MIRPCKPKWIERKTYETLSSSSKNFGSQKTYKGGRRPKAAAPLCMFFSDPKLFRLVLKSRIFSFQSILACRGSQKLHFGDLGLTSKLRSLVALRGEKSKKNGYLRIQGRMHIFEKNVTEGFKSRFDTVER